MQPAVPADEMLISSGGRKSLPSRKHEALEKFSSKIGSKLKPHELLK